MSATMSSSSQNADSWINLFCSIVGHEYFAEISEDFIEDDFNLTGLQSQVPLYKEALEMILDVEPETDYSDEGETEEDEEEEEDPSLVDSDPNKPHGGSSQHEQSWFDRQDRRIEQRRSRMTRDYPAIETSAEMLYGLIHQRYITSRQGIQQMLEKYEVGHFGTCPRVHCRGAKVLPVGCSDIPGLDTVKLFCPSCLDVYAPPNSRFQTVDGAFFGTTFGCLFFMTFPELDVGASPSKSHNAAGSSSDPNADERVINGVPAHNLAPGLGKGRVFEPRIYGFRVSEYARSGPRMKWLRQKPDKLEYLDEATMLQERKLYGEASSMDEEEDEGEPAGQEGEEGQAAGVEEQVDDDTGRGKKGRQRSSTGGKGGS